MKKNTILAAVCCLPLSLMAQKGFTIKGTVGTLNAPATAYLTYKNDGKEVKDSAVLRKGVFTFTGKVSFATPAEIFVKHDTITRTGYYRKDILGFYLENSIITMTSKDSLYRAVVKGSATNEEERTLRNMQRPYRESANRLMAEYQAKSPEEKKDSAFLKAAQETMRQTQASFDSVGRAFIAQYPNSLIALNTFNVIELAYNFNPDTAAARFARFPANVRNSYAGKQVHEAIEKGKRTDVGKTAIDFSQKDSTGKVVKLSDFRGQYVLLDFWASWCAPCRAENPNMLAAYNKYKSKNFTILGVSLDEENGRRAWLGAVKVDGMPWTQVSDLKGFKSEAAVMYGVSAIPTNYLIDPAGKIIAKNLRGEDLDKKLGELFK